MAVKGTRVSGTINGSTTTVPLKIMLDKDNPTNPPYVVDAFDENKILYQYNPTNKDWEPTGSNDDELDVPLSTRTRQPTVGEFLNSNKKMFTDNTTAIINKFSDQEKQNWYNSNTYQPFNSWRDSSNASQQSSQTDGVTLDISTGPNQIIGEDKRSWGSDESPYVYPAELRNNQQDYIQFEIVEYKTRKPDPSKGNLQFKPRNTEKIIKKTILLPIQPSITDSNTVDWNSGSINAIELAAVGLSGELMNPTTNTDIEGTLSAIGNKLTLDANTQKAVRLYLQQKAVGVNGLLSRLGGAVLNPNMELLFQGPTLRPFSFNFRLSPRNGPEAIQVKKIIRTFKESMSVKFASDELFLAAPYVYEIKYVNRYKGKNEEHPSINKIKTCALKSCNVDYTPDGSYMTFNEENATMTSYNLSLQFQELEPVTSKDYDTQIDQIGF